MHSIKISDEYSNRTEQKNESFPEKKHAQNEKYNTDYSCASTSPYITYEYTHEKENHRVPTVFHEFSQQSKKHMKQR